MRNSHHICRANICRMHSRASPDTFQSGSMLGVLWCFLVFFTAAAMASSVSPLGVILNTPDDSVGFPLQPCSRRVRTCSGVIPGFTSLQPISVEVISQSPTVIVSDCAAGLSASVITNFMGVNWHQAAGSASFWTRPTLLGSIRRSSRIRWMGGRRGLAELASGGWFG